MNARIFMSQLRMSLTLYLRTPAAVFWAFAFPILMLLGLGTIFGGQGDVGVKLVWLQSAPPSDADTRLANALQERGLKLETLSPEQGEARWKLGKLPAMLESAGGQYRLRVNTCSRRRACKPRPWCSRASWLLRRAPRVRPNRRESLS